MNVVAFILLICVSFKSTEAHKKMQLITDDRAQSNRMHRQGKQLLQKFRLSIQAVVPTTNSIQVLCLWHISLQKNGEKCLFVLLIQKSIPPKCWNFIHPSIGTSHKIRYLRFVFRILIVFRYIWNLTVYWKKNSISSTHLFSDYLHSKIGMLICVKIYLQKSRQ